MPSANANKWFIPYESLDNDQKRLVKGGVFPQGENIGIINGPAGSGKTIILVNALMQGNFQSVAFVSYTRSLLNLAKQGLPYNIRAMTYFEALRDHHNYDLIVIDEVQDVPLHALNTIKGKATKVILAGDNFQKIFEDGADNDSLKNICQGNTHKLMRTYRLTPKAYAAASKIHPGALEGVAPSGKMVVPIELYFTNSHSDGEALTYQIAKKQASLRRTAAILLPTKKSIVDFANWALQSEGHPIWKIEMTTGRFSKLDFDSLNIHLKNYSVKLQVVQNDFGDLNDAFENNQIVLQTYHSAKGLDYEVVCLPNASVEEATASSSLHNSLFYVAITRASGALIITQQHDCISPYIKKIQEFCSVIDPNRLTTTEDDSEF